MTIDRKSCPSIAGRSVNRPSRAAEKDLDDAEQLVGREHGGRGGQHLVRTGRGGGTLDEPAVLRRDDRG